MLFALVLVIVATSNAFADRAKKPAGRPGEMQRVTSTVAPFGSPMHAVLEATMMALNQVVAVERPVVRQNTAKIEPAKVQGLNRDADSNRRDSRIVSARSSNDVVTVRIELASDEATLDVGLYNMLGKKVQDVFRGPASRGPHEYTAPVSDLPEGVYICVMQGSDFRRAEKFYLSR